MFLKKMLDDAIYDMRTYYPEDTWKRAFIVIFIVFPRAVCVLCFDPLWEIQNAIKGRKYRRKNATKR